MDVLVVTSLYPPHSYGGYETSCRDVVDRWRRRGHRVVVLTTRTRVAGVEDDPSELDVRRELDWYWEDHRIPPQTWRQRLRVERSNAAALRLALDEVQPHVVSAWAMGALSLGLLSTVVAAGHPLVLVVCDDWLLYGERVDRWREPFARHRLLGMAVSAVTGLPTGWPDAHRVRAVYNSQAVRTAAAAARWRPALSSVVLPGVDHDDFPVPAEVPDRPWRWRMLQVGRIDPRKGIEVAVRAAAQLPQAQLDVVGRGDELHRRALAALADELGAGGRVTLRDALPRAQLAPVYARADVALFPVLWDEPFGIVPLEAMACGTPVVTTATGGSASFLEDGRNCLVVPRGDATAVAAAVRRLAEDVLLRRRLVTGGLATAAAHGADGYADELEREHAAAAAG